jgi:hypothetical protein
MRFLLQDKTLSKVDDSNHSEVVSYMFVLEYKDKMFIRIYQIYFEIIFLRVPQQIIRADFVWSNVW